MSFQFPCPHCGRKLRLAKRADGKTIACPSCRKKLVVPKASDPVEEANDNASAPTTLTPAKNPSAILNELPRSLPEDAKALGAPVALYKGSSSNAIVLMAIGVALAIFGPLASIWAVIDRRMMDLPIVTFGCGGIMLAFGVLLIVVAWQDSSMRVAVFTKGLLHVRGRTVDVIPWDEVESVFQKITEHYSGVIKVRTTYDYTIQKRGEDQSLVLGDNVADIKTLGETIQQEVTRVMLPALLASFNRGERLTFGPLIIDKQFLTHEDAFLAWEEVKGLKLDKGTFMVLKKGKWLAWTSVTVDKIANLMVFLALVDDILGRHNRIVPDNGPEPTHLSR